MVAIRPRYRYDIHQQRCIGFLVQRNITDRQGAKGLSVVTIFQGNEFSFLRLTEITPVVKAHLQRNFDG